MTPTLLVLFGGSVLLFTLRRKRYRHRRYKVRGFIPVLAMVLEGMIALLATASFAYGMIQLLD